MRKFGLGHAFILLCFVIQICESMVIHASRACLRPSLLAFITLSLVPYTHAHFGLLSGHGSLLRRQPVALLASCISMSLRRDLRRADRAGRCERDCIACPQMYQCNKSSGPSHRHRVSGSAATIGVSKKNKCGSSRIAGEPVKQSIHTTLHHFLSKTSTELSSLCAFARKFTLHARTCTHVGLALSAVLHDPHGT